MNINKKASRIIGILYIIGTIAGILSVVFTGAMRAPDYLTALAESRNTFILGTLFILLMGLALAMVPVVALPIFKKENKTLAVGFVVFRSALEAMTYIASILNMLLLLSVSLSYVQANVADQGMFTNLGTILQEADTWINEIRVLVFGISALILNVILYKSKLVPRWISIWGLIGAALHIPNGLMGMFGVVDVMSTTATLIDMPIALQEMVFAVYLIIKGFADQTQE